MALPSGGRADRSPTKDHEFEDERGACCCRFKPSRGLSYRDAVGTNILRQNQRADRTLGWRHSLSADALYHRFFVFFRRQIFSNFDLVFGDRGDARFVAFIHEHLYRWLYLRTGLLSPPFFFDQTKPLGYSDAFLFDQVIYAPLRILGAEPLLALTLTAVLLSPIAYLFLYLFLRRLNVSVPVASLGALIFTFANNLYLTAGHFQQFAVYYIPIIAYCSLVRRQQRTPPAAACLRAWSIRSRNIVFNRLLHGLVFWPWAVDICPIAGYVTWSDVRAWWRMTPTRVLWLGIVASVGFLATLSIFVTIYAPVLAAGAERNFGEYLFTPLSRWISSMWEWKISSGAA